MNGWLDGLLKTIQEPGSVTDLFGQRQQLLSECKSERGKEGGNMEHFDELGERVSRLPPATAKDFPSAQAAICALVDRTKPVHNAWVSGWLS